MAKTEITDWRDHGAVPTEPTNDSESQRMRHESNADTFDHDEKKPAADKPADKSQQPS